MRHCFAIVALMLLASCIRPSSPAALEGAPSESSHMVGLAAPPFTLVDQEGKKTSLADFKGKWVVLYFFGKEDTPGCACGFNEFTQLLLDLPKVHASALAINDAAPEDNLYSRDKYSLEITVLSDVDSVVMGQYKIRDSADDPIVRETFIVDPTGHIVAHWPTVIADGHVDRINAKLKDLGVR